VRSPISGRISNATVTQGNLINGGTTNATILTTVVSLDPIYCYVEVDERSALKYRELFRQGKRASARYGQVEAQMGLANQEGYPHRGVIDFVDNQINPSTGAIRARGVFPNADRLMAPGFFARLRIPGSGEYEAMLVRDSAIGNDQGKPFVMVVDGSNVVSQRPVTLGPMEDGLRIVREGLRPEDRVIVNGLVAARAGASVRVTEEAPMKPVVVAAAVPVTAGK
jgi:RND family efflux transporter MFP subunit